MSDDLISHYRALLAEHGPGSQAVQYADRDTHLARFSVLCDVAAPLGSVLDIGCGSGALWQYLRARGDDARYHGVDVVPEFVELAATAMAEDARAEVSLGRADAPLP
ncbi:class I SAM-dependent methyltransferase [Rhodobacteraceae bacterium CCMM004]|nr:class I SAM-dependent methyltransferase [Rhodobacteraceae bacterium CCMM004]